MFICDACLKEHYNNSGSAFKSGGKCEVCNQNAACNEIASFHLRPIIKDKSKRVVLQLSLSPTEAVFDGVLSVTEVKDTARGVISSKGQMPFKADKEDLENMYEAIGKILGKKTYSKEFVVWYSGIAEEKIDRAHRRFIEETEDQPTTNG